MNLIILLNLNESITVGFNLSDFKSKDLCIIVLHYVFYTNNE